MRDAATIARFRAIAIPPAWTDVWIAADPDAHVQATGRDARGRLQYRYHPTWRARRERAKYDKLADLCRALPALRRRVARDLGRDGVELDTVVAAVVALIERGYLRVGNVEYTRDNGSYGATTLENRHLRLRGDLLELRYVGKAGVERHITIDDATLADVLRRVRRLPGERLFQYERDGKVRAVTSGDVNRYLRAVIGEQFSAKDFRTWAATISCALRLALREPPASEAAGKRTIKAVVTEVAQQLGHTPAVCRQSYLHPRVLSAFRDGTLASYFPGAARTLRAFAAGAGRTAAEHALAALLDDRAREPVRLAA